MRRSLLPIALVALLAAAVSSSAGASPWPRAQAAGGCRVNPSSHKYGTTYLFSLSVARVSCARGVAVVKAFNGCRHRHGKAGRCGGALGFRCREHRYARIATEYDSKTTCSQGRRVVRFHYEQFT